MTPRLMMLSVALVACAGTAALPAAAQPQVQGTQSSPAAPVAAAAASTAPTPPPAAIPRWARVSFYANVASTTGADGSSSSFSEIVTNVAAQSVQHAGNGFEDRSRCPFRRVPVDRRPGSPHVRL